MVRVSKRRSTHMRSLLPRPSTASGCHSELAGAESVCFGPIRISPPARTSRPYKRRRYRPSFQDRRGYAPLGSSSPQDALLTKPSSMFVSSRYRLTIELPNRALPEVSQGAPSPGQAPARWIGSKDSALVLGLPGASPTTLLATALPLTEINHSRSRNTYSRTSANRSQLLYQGLLK